MRQVASDVAFAIYLFKAWGQKKTTEKKVLQSMIQLSENLPLISVVITTYNYAAFLPTAIKSALNQTYPNVEIIIIDDGSKDDTKSVIIDSWPVSYFYQENQGLSAARNSGFQKSCGVYIVFLDADDWLLTDALEKNYMAIKDDPQLAFISGNYYLLRAGENKAEPFFASVTNNHFERLLQGNYIGMHAAVMYRRWVLNEFKFDETLNACEDYDLYLTIARKYPVYHHEQFIATYYFHASGLSHNFQVMKDSIIAVLVKQAQFINSAPEALAYTKGLEQWKDYDRLLQRNI